MCCGGGGGGGGPGAGGGGGAGGGAPRPSSEMTGSGGPGERPGRGGLTPALEDGRLEPGLSMPAINRGHYNSHEDTILT